MATLDRYVREDIAHGYCFRVTDPQLREHFVNVVNNLYGVTDRGPRGRTVGHTADNRARIAEPRFPGAVPCSIMREDLDLLRKEHYVAFEKTDGTRYLMLCTSLPAPRRGDPPTNFCVLVNRRWEARIVRVQFAQDVYDRNTLFDGELVQNTETGRWVFLIFDLVSSGHVSTSRDNYVKRMKSAHQIVHNSLRQEPSVDAFDISVKRYEKMEQMDRLYNAEKNYRGFPTDGYVFMPVRRFVAPFRNRQILKWKDSSNSTVDFQLRFSAENGLEYWMKDTHSAPKYFGPVAIDFTLAESHTELIQKYAERVRSAGDQPIVECAFDQSRHLWYMVCERNDKQSPNAEYTVQRTLDNVRENITKDELFHIIANERVVYQPDSRSTVHHQQRHSSPGLAPNIGDPFAVDTPYQQQQQQEQYCSFYQGTDHRTEDLRRRQPYEQQPVHRHFEQPPQHPHMRSDGRLGPRYESQYPQQQNYQEQHFRVPHEPHTVQQGRTDARNPQSFVHKDRQAIIGALSSSLIHNVSQSSPKRHPFIAEHDSLKPYYDNTPFQTPKPIADPPTVHSHHFSHSIPQQNHRQQQQQRRLGVKESPPFFESSPYVSCGHGPLGPDDSASSEIFAQYAYDEDDELDQGIANSRKKRKLSNIEDGNQPKEHTNGRFNSSSNNNDQYNSRPPMLNYDRFTVIDTVSGADMRPAPFHPSLFEDDNDNDDDGDNDEQNAKFTKMHDEDDALFDDDPPPAHFLPPKESYEDASILTSSASPLGRQSEIGVVPILVDDIVQKDQGVAQNIGATSIQEMLAQLSNTLQSAPDSVLAHALKNVK